MSRIRRRCGQLCCDTKTQAAITCCTYILYSPSVEDVAGSGDDTSTGDLS